MSTSRYLSLSPHDLVPDGDTDKTVQNTRRTRFTATLHGARSLISQGRRDDCRGHFPWRGVLWRSAAAVLFSVLITVVLYSFASRDSLTTWERRAFNTLTILFSSLVSLSLGSLLGLLGAALRWRLLARNTSTPRDVDLILGIHNPTGALKLIHHHVVSQGKCSTTTLIVTLYLLVNIVGRLSVAAFGLTYNLDENVGVEYPIAVTDFSGFPWMIERDSEIGDSWDLIYEARENIMELGKQALVGLVYMPSLFSSSNPSLHSMTNIDGRGVDRNVEADTVTYSYSLREYRGPNAYPSAERVVHSSSRCIARRFFNGTFYANGQAVATPDLNESANIDHEPEFARVLLALAHAKQDNPDDPGYYWVVPYRGASRTDNMEDPSACATTYITGDFSNFTRGISIYECSTCLTDRNHKPGFGSNFFYGCPAENALYAAGMVLRVGGRSSAGVSWEYITKGADRDDRITFRRYPINTDSYEFVDWVPEGYPDLVGGTLPNDWFKDPIEQKDELQVAHLTARVPILALLGAQERLPKVTLEKDASERPFITTKLEVKWDRAISTLAALLSGQVLVVGVVFWACRGVPIRDHDSYLSVARLLRTAMSSIGGGSGDSGRELAQRIQDELARRAQKEEDAELEVSKLGIRYGVRMRPNEDGGESAEVDIWSDVKDFDRQLPYD